MEIKAIVFDWGDTVMRDFPFEGAMKDWPFVAAIPGIEDTLAELKKKYILVMGSNARAFQFSKDICEALRKRLSFSIISTMYFLLKTWVLKSHTYSFLRVLKRN